MTEKESKDILLKDMKEQDARIEAEIQTCVVLYDNVEKHTEYLEKRTEEQEIFERMLQRISGKRGSFDDSVTMRKLDSRVLAEEREITKNKKLIHEQQAYYEALRKKDVWALWGQEEEKSALAAICFAFGQERETSDEIAAKFLRTRSRLPEQTARYLLEKALSYSESREEADDIAEETDSLLRELLHRTRFPQSDETWQGIETFLNIRKTKRAAARREALFDAYEKAKEQFDTFEKGYDGCGKILKEIQKWKKKTGRETIAAVKNTEEWFDAKKAELDLLVESRRSETARIDAVLQDLERFQADLKVCKESGAEPDDAMCIRLKSLAGEKVENVETETLKQEKTKLLGTYDNEYAEKMKTAEAADIKKAKDDKESEDAAKLAELERKIREREEAKAKLREWFVSYAKRFAAILVILCSIVGIKVAYDRYTDIDAVEDAQFYISLAREGNIKIISVKNENEDFLFFNPFGASWLEIHAPLKKVKIYNGTERVSINCENLKELTIPDSVTSLRLYNVKDEFASTLGLPKNLESLDIGGCPNLTDAGFRALKIPESVRSLKIGEDRCENLKNIDISNHLESLYVGTLAGSTVNVDGDVQTVEIDASEGSSTVNVNGDAQTVHISGFGGSSDYLASFTVNVNGDVRTLEIYDADNLTVNGNGKIDILDRWMGNTDGNMELNLVPRVLNWRYDGEEGLTLPEGIEVLNLKYSGKNELVLPEGIKILYLWEREPNDKSLEIPGSVRGLRIHSDTLDFDALKIPEGILYYKLSRGDDDREYQAENCPQELLDVMRSLGNGGNGSDIDIGILSVLGA